MPKETGNLITHGVKLLSHEKKTVDYFLGLGYTVELIPLSNIKGVRSADIKMLGLEWEIKRPKKSDHRAISHIFKKATRQSANLIFDLRSLQNARDTNSITTLSNAYAKSKRVKNMLIINKKSQLLDFSKNRGKIKAL